MATTPAWFPTRIQSHGSDQVFHFDRDGLLRRHDYNLEIVGNLAIADYTDDHQMCGRISFPTLRRAVGRRPEGLAIPDPAFITIDISHVTLAG